jgi:HPt (histidine-containing phosphotransfer) domain-containing protein
MIEDHSRCIEAGMNAFLSKPLNTAALADALRPYRQSVWPSPSPEVPPRKTADKAVFDHTAFIRLMGDAGLAVTVADSFLSDMPARIEALQQSVAAANTRHARNLAHQLKGVARTMGGKNFERVTAEMEAAATHADLPALRALSPQLSAEFDRLRQALADRYAKS